MLRSPPDAHDEHVRKLLDQRATRADLYSRVPSLSEFSDTPSVYSHPFFSPRPEIREDDHHSFRSLSPSLTSTGPRRAERNRINELAESMLDLDDDPRSSFASSSTFDDEYTGSIDPDDEDEDSVLRMSVLGPKMRVHSKAPWEVDADPISDEGESSSGSKSSFTLGPFSRKRQPSLESSRSPVSSSGKRSIETSSSYSRGHPTPHLTPSSSSSMPPHPTHPASRSPFSRSHVRSPSPTLAQSPLLLPTSSGSPPPESFISSLHDDSDNTLSRIISNSSRPSEEGGHPYANPKHARSSSSHSSYRRVPEVPPPPCPPVPRSDSSVTVTESAFLKAISKPQDNHPSEDIVPRSPTSIFQGRGISSPMPLQHKREDSASINRSPQFPGWMERAGSMHNFNLISLEEARAQRSRSATTTVPFPDRDSDQASNHSSTSHAVPSRTRARSISTGARAKQAITSMVAKPDRRDSEPAVVTSSNNSPGKTLKSKRSGFLRLFNGRDDRSPPPPVPSLSDGVAAFQAQQSTQHSTKPPPHRIPVPQLSPSLIMDDSPTKSSSPKRTPPPLSINTSPVARASTTGVSANFGDRLRPPADVNMPQSAPANITEFPALKLRPMSSLFSAQFGEIFTGESESNVSPTEVETPSSLAPSTVVSPTTSVSFSRYSDKVSVVTAGDDQSSVIRALQDQIISAKKAWQRHIWELEGQIRDLKEEVETLRATDKEEEYCSTCGRGHRPTDSSDIP